MSTKVKVIRLLRLAEDRAGTPEGDTAQRIAEQLIATHDIQIEDDDIAFEEAPEVIHHLMYEGEQRLWWPEMMLVTLCDLYGGEVVVMQGAPWRVYVVIEPEDHVELSVLEKHFKYLCELIEDLYHACASEFMKAVPAERDKAIESFCIGAVFRISQMLYTQERQEQPDLEEMPFMVRALTGTVEEPREVKDPGLWPPPVPLEMGRQVHDDLIEIIPDWSWFDEGYRNAKTLIGSPYPY